jgi:hypothetical protein
MSPYLAAVLAIIALVCPPVGYVFYESVLSQDNWIYRGNGQWQDGGMQGGTHGAPGPVAGAGLPGLLIVGGIYWVVRRSRQNANKRPPQLVASSSD